MTGVAPNQLANPNLKWEAKEETTVGLDYGIFGGRVYGSLDLYRNTTNDLLLNVQIPAPAPVAFQIQNVGSIRNTGVDFSLDALAYQRGSAALTLGITASTNKNEVLDLGGRNQIFTGTISGRGQSNQTSLLLTPGQPFPVFYGAEFSGQFDSNGFPLYNNYEDSDNDGFNDRRVADDPSTPNVDESFVTIPGEDDKQIIGDPRPNFVYGFRVGLELGPVNLRAFFRGEQGRQLFNNTNLVYSSQGAALSGFNFIQGDFDAAESPNAPAVYSDRFIENASFLRLDQLTLEYAIPTRYLGPAIAANLRSARVYVTGNNLFVITPYSGVDPEVNANASRDGISAIGIDYLPYPRARTFTVGIGLGL